MDFRERLYNALMANANIIYGGMHPGQNSYQWPQIQSYSTMGSGRSGGSRSGGARSGGARSGGGRSGGAARRRRAPARRKAAAPRRRRGGVLIDEFYDY